MGVKTWYRRIQVQSSVCFPKAEKSTRAQLGSSPQLLWEDCRDTAMAGQWFVGGLIGKTKRRCFSGWLDKKQHLGWQQNTHIISHAVQGSSPYSLLPFLSVPFSSNSSVEGSWGTVSCSWEGTYAALLALKPSKMQQPPVPAAEDAHTAPSPCRQAGQRQPQHPQVLLSLFSQTIPDPPGDPSGTHVTQQPSPNQACVLPVIWSFPFKQYMSWNWY